MKISVITVCYNSERFISSAIDSVLNQSYGNIEYIIVDGGSEDDTVQIIHSYIEQIQHCISEPDDGIYCALNKGLSLASGDVIGILNSDDFYPNEDVLAKVADCFSNHQNVEMVLGNVEFVDAETADRCIRFYSSIYFEPWKLRFGFMPPHPAAFIKRSAYANVGFYEEDYKISGDFEWFVRALLLQRLPYAKLKETLVRMREGGVSTAGLNSYWVSSKEQLKALHVNGVYSNLAFVLLRLPIKFLCKVFCRP